MLNLAIRFGNGDGEAEDVRHSKYTFGRGILTTNFYVEYNLWSMLRFLIENILKFIFFNFDFDFSSCAEFEWGKVYEAQAVSKNEAITVSAFGLAIAL